MKKIINIIIVSSIIIVSFTGGLKSLFIDEIRCSSGIEIETFYIQNGDEQVAFLGCRVIK